MEYTKAQINRLIGVNESYQAPTKLMATLMNSEKRGQLFKRFLSIDSDMSTDWFSKYFEKLMADQTKLKQDFTPPEVANLMMRLMGNTNEYYEIAAGTGAILVARWWSDCLQHSPFTYRPSMYIYTVEEISSAALPFLLFNCAIRGMNAIVVHGDSLTRAANQVYFVQNDQDDAFSFSSINVMPHTDAVAKTLGINAWAEAAIDHIESPVHQTISGGNK